MMRGLAGAIVTLLAGCQSCPPMRANWYLQDDAAGQRLLLALVNEGRTATSLASVAVNPPEGGARGGWRHGGPVSMQAGQVLVLPLEAFRNADGAPFPACQLPVFVAVQCQVERSPDAARLGGTLPNYLPLAWIERCGAGSRP